MASYRDLCAARQPLLDGHFGEQVLVMPWLAGDVFAGGPDPSLPQFTAVGVLDLPTKIQRVEGAAGVTGARSDLIQPDPQVDFAASVFDAGLTPQKGWRIAATSRAGEPVFKIVAVEPDGLGRIVCALLQV